MKKIGILVLLVVGLSMIVGLIWLYESNQTTPLTNTNTNRPPTWTSDVANELVIVQLDPADPEHYSFDLEPFGRLTFAEIGETQTIDNRQLRLVSVTSSSGQVLVSPLGY